jgi:hypothetical protein
MNNIKSSYRLVATRILRVYHNLLPVELNSILKTEVENFSETSATQLSPKWYQDQQQQLLNLRKKIDRKFAGPPRNRTPVNQPKISCLPHSTIIDLTFRAKWNLCVLSDTLESKSVVQTASCEGGGGGRFAAGRRAGWRIYCGGLAGRLYHVCVSCDIASWFIYSIMKTSVPWNSHAVPVIKCIWNNINDDIWFKSIILFLFNIKFLRLFLNRFLIVSFNF